MQILTCEFGTAIEIDDCASNSILGARGDKVYIGVEAPTESSIRKHEVYLLTQAEKARLKLSE